MKINLLKLALFAVIAFTACKQEEISAGSSSATQEELAQIKALGFSTKDVIKEDNGFVVEGDIFLTKEDLARQFNGQTLRIAQTEQYRTTNLVTGLPRTITVSLSNKLPSTYGPALDTMVKRYNAENLQIKFSRVNRNGNIVFEKAPTFALYLASAGFPTSTGNPYNQVLVNVTQIGQNPNVNWLATILTHEAGHCIGFRHTDYMDRSFSCGGATSNEGDGGVGAIQIPGTPATADAGSWMLACIGANQNRPFNTNDVTALNYLY